MKPSKVWGAALGELELQVSRSTFDTWLRGARLVSCEDGEYIIGVDSDFARDWLEARMRMAVERTVAGIVGGAATVSFVVWPKKGGGRSGESQLALDTPSNTPHQRQAVARPRYSFDDFVVGPGTRMAHAAARAVTDAPRPGHNPLVIYGDVGLGKTHLLHAIACECSRAGRKTVLITAEEFTNELVTAIRARTNESFREKHRTPDVWLVDDIQFFIGKKSSQEEFMHTLSSLCAANRQVVLACDQAPESLSALGPRTCSRMVSGLAVAISPPNALERAAILRAKASRFPEEIPDAVLDFMADNIPSHVRALEGALHRLVIHARVIGHPIDLASAASTVSQRASTPRRVAPSDRVISAVAGRFHVTTGELCGKGRSRRVTVPRHLAMHLLREQGGRSLAEIGAILGGRDHSTVRHGCNSAQALVSNDTEIRAHATWLREHLSRAE